MKLFKRNIFITAFATCLLSTLLIDGTSVNADELLTQSHDANFWSMTEKVEDVYKPKRLSLTTVTTDDMSLNDELSLEDYILNGIRNFDTIIDLSEYKINFEDEIIGETLNKINLMYPELFYLDSNYSTNYYNSSKCIKDLYLEYKYDENEYQQCIQKIDNKFDEVISVIDDSMSDVEKALLVHDYLCVNFSYDVRTDQKVLNHKLDEFINDGYGVCQAYMYAYSYILNKLNIKNYPVISTSLKHTWNMVELDGKYYQIDVTWDDYVPELLGWSSHSYFMLTDDEINQNHATDWYVYKDEIYATDTSYQNHIFKSLKSPSIAIDGKVYCINKDGLFCQYDVVTDTVNQVSDLVSSYKWYKYNASVTSYYGNKYSSLYSYKDILIYNTPESIIAIDKNGNYLNTIYSRSSVNDAIFGITIKDGLLLAQIESNLNVDRDDFGKNVVEVCTLEDWYQNFKSNPPVETTTPETTTTEVTTTTTPETTTTEITTTTTPETTTTEVTTTTTPETTTTTESTTTTTTTINYFIKYNPDINDDNVIDGKDLFMLKKYLSNLYISSFNFYDVNDDGDVNILDLLTLKNIIFSLEE